MLSSSFKAAVKIKQEWSYKMGRIWSGAHLPGNIKDKALQKEVLKEWWSLISVVSHQEFHFISKIIRQLL